ncbi:class I SAM-dependent methyltransferase [Paenibacillus sp. V4I7]|uniref:class I SAM-dependent methyltransferase n=1 Tax=Paenibacillus sp. V4I7 TaxID=3042307 RepID=UPI002782714C|nr:class I SAM-dependent methyltransferase [Paenibacillus sp. V4I7]MDQ0899423.1 hypothetical protein [Paenibacillus sp. V4I7]
MPATKGIFCPFGLVKLRTLNGVGLISKILKSRTLGLLNDGTDEFSFALIHAQPHNPLGFLLSHFKGGENMNRSEYKDFYDKVGQLNGWDFSKLRTTSEGEQWNFLYEVTQRCKKSDLLLDIGTGGGEALLSIADAALILVGIDHSKGMIKSATENLKKSNKTNIRFLQMEAENITFSEFFFIVVSCRQFCEYYYADTHFSFSIYWNPDPIFVNSANIVHTDGTYTYCTGCGTYPVYDQWEQERLWIGTNKNPTSLLYTTVYDSSAHNGHLHTNSNSSLLEDYYPNAKVTLGDNYVIGYFELKNYDKTLPSGPLKEHLFPKRYRQNFN